MPIFAESSLLILITIACIMLLVIYKYHNNSTVWDYAKVMNAVPHQKFQPDSYFDLQQIIQQYPSHKVSVAGAKYSHGGHTFFNDCLYIDMTGLDKIIELNQKVTPPELTVQAGTTWRQILEYLDPLNLSVKSMQSYANFTVGGSISVNAHGRDIHYSTVGSSLCSMKVLLMDAQTLTIYPSGETQELFRAVLGGYGGIAIILEATIQLTDNYPMKKVIKQAPINSVNDVFSSLQLNNNKEVVLYNGLIYPERRDQIFHTYFIRMPPHANPSTQSALQPQKDVYLGSLLGEQALRRSKIAKLCRAYLEPCLQSKGKETDDTVWRNWELSYDATSLGSLINLPTTTVLQEYFVPINNAAITKFLDAFNRITKEYCVNLLNISLRYVRAPTLQGQHPILDYANVDRVALVIYYNIGNSDLAMAKGAEWTQKVLDVLLSDDVRGTYYLPYLPFATVKQFRLAYPDWIKFLQIKKKYDPKDRLSSKFFELYLAT
jgi:FAD/FMN-containing dehydrogenase